MGSLQGKIFNQIIIRVQNINTPAAIRKMRRLSAPFINDRVDRAYTLEKGETAAGTRYLRMKRAGGAEPRKIIYYLHGGGYVCGIISLYKELNEGFCDLEEGVEVFLLDYRLAPEYRFPTQLKEALDLWHELAGHFGPKQIILGGDSSGGNLTLALMLKLRDEGEPLPAAAFLISAWTDMLASGASYIENYHHDAEMGKRTGHLTEAKRQEVLQGELYCFIGEADRTHPYLSPVYGDYEGFPPMMFMVGGYEMLLDDTLTVAEKLRRCGVPVICEQQPEMFHNYVLYKDYIPESRASYEKLLRFVQERLNEMEPEAAPE